ncbi:MAG: pyridoxal-phosphate dependent enzyme, partial [Chloroflexi bacterium]|nr:pyridoxal-phosphate dependent enzyme [Chloroflexota bacterium]
SVERRQLLELFGAKVHLSDGLRGTNGSIEVAERMAAADPRYLLLYQYGNPANPQAHYETTGPEILRDMGDLPVDVFIAGLGTGGTLMGVGRYLKECHPTIRVIGVVPHPGDLVQGLRSLDEGFIPPILDETVLDGKIVVSSRDSFIATRELTRQEGIFAGISAGAVIHCARRIAHRRERGNIVVLLADGGWKYLSTNLWTQQAEEDEGIDSKVWW